MAEPLPLEESGPGLLRRFILPGAFVIALFVVLWMRRDDAPPDTDWSIAGQALGTTFSVKIVPAESGDTALREKAEAAIVAALQLVDEQMSTWREDSVLSAVNAHPVGQSMDIPAELAEVLALSERISIATDGAFDITVGPLVAAWGFGAGKKLTPPTDAELTALRGRIGFRHVRLEGQAVTRLADVRLDLSAIAKGYAVDLIGRRLAALGLERWMVEVGGEVLTRGKRRDGGPWRLGVERPDPDASEADRTVTSVIGLSGRALATSGDYRQFREIDGRVVSHTIDPRTGKPVEHGPSSVSVVADDCATADAWATALMVLGPKGAERAAQAGLAVLIIERRPDGSVGQVGTPSFQELVLP